MNSLFFILIMPPLFFTYFERKIMLKFKDFFAGSIFIGLLVLFLTPLNSVTIAQDKPSKKFTIVIHGGAGFISKDIPDSIKKDYLNSLKIALSIGRNILAEGGKSIDAVEQVIRYMEDNPNFNSGKGAVFTVKGTHELDASIMDGKDLSTGAVAGVTIIKHPITLARKVKEKTKHVLLAGPGADQFGKEIGVEIVDNHYFDTPRRLKNWKKRHKKKTDKHGTVGAVAIDMYGNIAAGTSTGGTSDKMYGRVGDSPLINAGTYANNKTCGVSATGIGELFIRNTVAFNVSALMEYKGYTLKQAADEMIHKRLKPGTGGIIAVDKDGNYVFSFNTPGMFRGVANSKGLFEVKIWE